MSEQDKALLRRVPLEAFNEGRVDVVDEVMARNVVDHTPLPGFPSTPEEFKVFIRDFRSAVPDLHYTIDHEISESDLVVQHLTGHGTPQREFMGMPATGKSATWEEIHVIRMAGGKAVEHWGLIDMLSVMRQLGALPEARAA